MQLDVLSLDVITSRLSGKDAQVGIKARVLPTGHDKIRLGSKHIFAQHNFGEAFERIDAQLWVSADRQYLEHVKDLIPERLRQDHDMAGYASAVIPQDDSKHAILSYMLFLDEKSLDQLMRQVATVSAGSINVNVSIDGLRFRLPDEDVWEVVDVEHSSHFLPIRHFSIEVAKLRTTRVAIRDLHAKIGNQELADSDDAEERKLGVRWMLDASRQAAEQSLEPSLSILRQCRALLALLLMCAAVAIIQRF